ncbi:MAG: hypothetical protein IJ693_08465 [Bacteroidaceae bacterium]|nr:hypothetical protein [Bacteroidaceae bacterium]
MKRNEMRWIGVALMFVVCGMAAAQVKVTAPPPTLMQWLAGKESPLDAFYQKYVSAEGLPVVASAAVSDTALLQACYIANHMLQRIPEAREEMIRCHFRIGVVGYQENVTDLPECSMMKVWWPDTDWDKRGRGYGATLQLPVMSIGEENLVRIPNFRERYATESIMVHEFAHNVDFAMSRVNTAFRDSLRSAFRQARAEGLWAGTYSMTNSAEYFAEGAQAWFNTCRMHVPYRNGEGRFTLRSREQLRDYDPRLYALCASIFPEEHLHGYHFEE